MRFAIASEHILLGPAESAQEELETKHAFPFVCGKTRRVEKSLSVDERSRLYLAHAEAALETRHANEALESLTKALALCEETSTKKTPPLRWRFLVAKALSDAGQMCAARKELKELSKEVMEGVDVDLVHKYTQLCLLDQAEAVTSPTKRLRTMKSQDSQSMRSKSRVKNNKTLPYSQYSRSTYEV